MNSYDVTYLRAYVGDDWEQLGVPTGTCLSVIAPEDAIYCPGESWAISKPITVGQEIADGIPYEVEIGVTSGERWQGTARFVRLPFGSAALYQASPLTLGDSDRSP